MSNFPYAIDQYKEDNDHLFTMAATRTGQEKK